jgi:uncharacterized protein
MNLDLKYRQIIADYFQDKPVLKAYLFGSFVRGEATEQSDIDILVELDYSQSIGLGFVQMQMDLQEKLLKKVDLVSTGGLSKFIKPLIEQEKELIYAKTRGIIGSMKGFVTYMSGDFDEPLEDFKHYM